VAASSRTGVGKGRAPAIVYTVISVVVGLAVVGTVAIPQPIDEKKAESRYGKPFWFAATDMSAHFPLPAGNHRWTFNPWEDPARFRVGGFLLSYLVVLLPLICAARLVLYRRRPPPV